MSNDGTSSVGVAGLGAMGGPIARHLVGAGLDTVVFDRNRSTVDEHVEAGARAAASAAELGACDVVLVIVPADDDVLEVSAAVLTAAERGSVLLICSSVTPETCHRVAVEAEKVGVAVLDAALTGGIRGAVNGRIALLVGGDEAVLDRVRPALAPWTKAVHHLGPLGAGQIGKTVNNLCHWGQVTAVVEALRFGRRLGVEPAKLRPALLDGPAASNTLAELELMHFTWYRKDLANAFRMAGEVDHDLPVARLAREVMEGITVAGVAELLRGEGA
ncbi:NAD(P)-dependent oxidoreductase [Amycolatopsis rhabdoformis]|uniref:NAD(P)-dependent oxidoreductase n=1 Tax=Amycolatopsis rhabdoformis TaxID=1448059 RepID=A0ABZ1IJC2_9PSEU|nr:NAD(P)-dependent oxidoreductase [Amycolatopsis rhabdoformis]WSE33649.1 NAD(P)-dependent oxidoreductase [Amycolatopsis rhabdoformis]